MSSASVPVPYSKHKPLVITGESRSNEDSRPTSTASDDGDSNIVDRLLGDIRGGFTKKSGEITPKAKQVQLENGTVVTAFSSGDGKGDKDSTEPFTRSGSLRNSGRRSSLAQRLRSIDEANGLKKDGKDTDELFDLLLQAGESEAAAFDRQGSLRRRRRTRPNLDPLVLDRERAASPASVSSPGPNTTESDPSPVEKTEKIVPERRVWRSQSVTTNDKPDPKSLHCERRTTTTSRVNKPPQIEVSSSLDSPPQETFNQPEPVPAVSLVQENEEKPNEAEVSRDFEEKKMEMNKRRLERRRRSAMDLQSLLEARKNGGQPMGSPIKESPAGFENGFPEPELGGPELSSREKLLSRYQSRFSRRNADPTEFTSPVISNASSSMNGDINGANGQRETDKKESDLSDLFARRRLGSDSSRRWSTFEKSLGSLDVDQVIRDVERTGEEIQRIGARDGPSTSRFKRTWVKNLDTDKLLGKGGDEEEVSSSGRTSPTITPTDSAATTPRLRRWASALDRTDFDHTDDGTPTAPPRRQRSQGTLGDIGTPETPKNSSLTERALLEHTAGRWKSNVEPEDVNEALRNIAEESQSRIRPYSTYDNVPSDKVVENATTNGGDVSPITKRWGRVFSEEDKDSTESCLSRSATLPKRWKTGQWKKDILGQNTDDVIEEELKENNISTAAHVQDDDYFNLDRNNRFRKSLRLTGLRGEKKENAPISTTGWRKDAESQQLDSAVQEFHSKVPSTQREARKERFKALSRLYSDDNDNELWPTSNKGDQIHSRMNGDHDGCPLEQTISPRNSRIEDVKSDNESIASGKDEGFESESISDPSVSQRTSMSSTLDSDITLTPTLKRKEYQKAQLDEQEESRSNYFARSIDSLVLRPELTISDSTADIDIDGHPGTDKGEESFEEWTTTEYTTETNISDLPDEVRNVIMSKAPTTIEPPLVETPKTRSPSNGLSTSVTSRGQTENKTVTKSRPKPPTPKETSRTPGTTRKTFEKKSTTTSSAKSTPIKSKPSPSNTAAAVTDRLSRPKRPSGLSRHASNSSVNSEASSVAGTIGSPRSATRTTPKSRISSASSSRTNGVTSPSSSFVRGGTGRATMPASVLRTNKKAAAESKENGKDKEVPTPPRRTTSISQSVTDRLTAGISRTRDSPGSPTKTPTTPRRSTSFSASKDSSASKENKVKSFMSRLSTGKGRAEEMPATPRATPKSTSKVSPAPGKSSRPSDLSVSKVTSPRPTRRPIDTADDSKSPSFFKKIIDKSPHKKSSLNKSDTESPASARRGRVSVIKTTTKSSRC